MHAKIWTSRRRTLRTALFKLLQDEDNLRAEPALPSEQMETESMVTDVLLRFTYSECKIGLFKVEPRQFHTWVFKRYYAQNHLFRSVAEWGKKRPGLAQNGKRENVRNGKNCKFFRFTYNVIARLFRAVNVSLIIIHWEKANKVLTKLINLLQLIN